MKTIKFKNTLISKRNKVYFDSQPLIKTQSIIINNLTITLNIKTLISKKPIKVNKTLIGFN